MGIQKGSKVSINYKLTVDGQVVDSSEGKGPLSYEQGSGQIIPGLEKELEGLNVGDTKTVDIAADDAYGPRDPAKIQKVPRTAFAEADQLKVGSMVQGQLNDQVFTAVVVEITDANITLDTNHPLAGKELKFDVEIASVD